MARRARWIRRLAYRIPGFRGRAGQGEQADARMPALGQTTCFTSGTRTDRDGGGTLSYHAALQKGGGSAMRERMEDTGPKRDKPWIFRTYAGHSTAADSNALYRSNLSRGQTGLSVAFDLPTQTGYDPADPLSKGEVGKVGVPIPHLGEMRRLFEGIPLTEMNTSMTINATAMWLLALYQVVAEEQNGVSTGSTDERQEVAHRLAGTTQNDIIKEYLSRGTYVFPPEHSLRL